MSNAFLNAAWPLRMPAPEKAVYIALADRANENGICWPSVADLMVRTCLSERKVRSTIQWLAQHQAIEVDRKIRKTNTITLTPARYTPSLHHVHPAQGAPSPAQGAPLSLHEMQPPPAQRAPEPTSTTKASSSEALGNGAGSSHGSYPADFECAWSAYPKRSGSANKAGAYRAWKARIAEGAPAQELISGTRRYATWCVATGKVGTEMVKLAATFFGPDRHYLEDFAVPVQSAGRAQPIKTGGFLNTNYREGVNENGTF